jgi:hypothetical protein
MVWLLRFNNLNFQVHGNCIFKCIAKVEKMKNVFKSLRFYIRTFYRIATLIGLGFGAWKLVRHWRAGLAEKTGHTFDVSIRTTAERLEKTAIKLEKWADNHQGETVGKGLDVVLMDTQKTLDRATNLVQSALTHKN